MKVTLSVDLGFGLVKAVCEYYDESKAKVRRDKAKFISVIKNAETLNSLGGFLRSNDDYEVLFTDPSGKKRNYYVGDKAVTNIGTRKYTEKGDFDSETLKVLLGTAIVAVVPKEATSVDLILGLPLSFYEAHSDELVDVVRKFDGTIHWKDKTLNYTFNSTVVVPQGIGSYFDLIFDWNGRINNSSMATSAVGIITVGYRTIEYLVVKKGVNGMDIIPTLTDSIEKQGVNQYLDAIAQMIKQNYEIEISKEEIERAIISFDGELDTQAGTIQLNPLLPSIKKAYVDSVVGVIKPKWGSQLASLKHIVLSGGSALYFEDEFKSAFSNLIVHGNDPDGEVRKDAHIYSNAFGFLKSSKLG